MLIGALILLSLISLLLLNGAEGETVTVRQGDEILYQGPLRRDMTVDADGAYHNRIVIRNGEVYMAESDCPGGDCLHQGSIHRSGQRIACAPNGVIVSVTGKQESEVDVVAG